MEKQASVGSGTRRTSGQIIDAMIANLDGLTMKPIEVLMLLNDTAQSRIDMHGALRRIAEARVILAEARDFFHAAGADTAVLDVAVTQLTTSNKVPRCVRTETPLASDVRQASPVKLFCVGVYDWVAAVDAAQAMAFAIGLYGDLGSVDEPSELSAEDLDQLVVIDEESGLERTFGEQLAIDTAANEPVPRLFASTQS